jgi:hypothetical protein
VTHSCKRNNTLYQGSQLMIKIIRFIYFSEILGFHSGKEVYVGLLDCNAALTCKQITNFSGKHNLHLHP